MTSSSMNNRRVFVTTIADVNRETRKERRRELNEERKEWRRERRRCSNGCYRHHYGPAGGVSFLVSLIIKQGVKAYKKRKEGKQKAPAYKATKYTEKSDKVPVESVKSAETSNKTPSMEELPPYEP